MTAIPGVDVATPDQYPLVLTHDSEVRPLDAAVSLDGDQGLFRVTLESGGGGRNSEYRKALDVILKNAVEHGGYALVEVLLASKNALALGRGERRVELSRPYPRLAGESGAEIAREIVAELPRMLRDPEARPGGGNPTKRIEVYLSNPNAELEDLLSALDASVPEDRIVSDSSSSTQSRPRSLGQGRSHDSARNRAVELHAMEAAWTRFGADEWELENTSGNRPYDYVARKGDRTVHVEVKGTTQDLGTVEVTYGEVNAAREVETVLFVLYGIHAEKRVDGEWATTGGTRHEEWPWQPSDERLAAVRYRYCTR